MAQRRAHAVGAGVAAADDDHVLVLRRRCTGRPARLLSSRLLVLRVQELHGEVDALELAAGDGQVARLGRAAAEHDGVELGLRSWSAG